MSGNAVTPGSPLPWRADGGDVVAGPHGYLVALADEFGLHKVRVNRWVRGLPRPAQRIRRKVAA